MLKIGVKYGLISALIMVLVSVLFFVIGVEKVVSNFLITGIIQLLLFVAIIFIGIKAVRDYRTANENKISLKEAFITSITAFVIASFISVLFTYVLQNVIDPTYGDKMKQAVIQSTEQKLDNANVPEEQKEAILMGIEEKDMSMTIGKSALSFGISTGFFLIVSLIIGAAIKKDLNDTPPIV
jgi:hypothetical protein